MDINSTETARKRLLIVAEHRRGQGSGHVRRCARLAREMVRDAHVSVDWLMPVEGTPSHYGREEVRQFVDAEVLPVRWVDRPEGPYHVVILDRREATLEELQRLAPEGISVGVDLAGEARDYVDYAIDALETPDGVTRPNVADAGLLFLPDAVRDDWPEEIKHVLVVFGGEGTPDEAVARAAGLARESSLTVTLVAPLAAAPQRTIPDGVHILSAHGDLADHLSRYDAVVTHYGLTAYEAVWARVPVILWNPSAYHDRLSHKAGFAVAGNLEEVKDALLRPDRILEASKRVRPAGKSRLSSLISELVAPARAASPIGEQRWHPVEERFAERSFFRDRTTGLVFMQRYRPMNIRYDEDYFFAEYRKQYGRTYLEDFAHIEQLGYRRVRMIRRYMPRSRGVRVLDIGCAYGPFLRAAQGAGWEPHGVDVAGDAVRYVTDTLGYPAVCGDITTMDTSALQGPFDVITMWYVIEHFPDVRRLMQVVSSLLKPGGVFAFSTPNLGGISGRRDRREFFRRSPEDHYTLFDAHTVRSVMEHFGFAVRGMRSTGHHPERFGLPLGRRGAAAGGVRYRVLHALSRMAQLGDTFEIVTEKLT